MCPDRANFYNLWWKDNSGPQRNYNGLHSVWGWTGTLQARWDVVNPSDVPAGYQPNEDNFIVVPASVVPGTFQFSVTPTVITFEVNLTYVALFQYEMMHLHFRYSESLNVGCDAFIKLPWDPAAGSDFQITNTTFSPSTFPGNGAQVQVQHTFNYPALTTYSLPTTFDPTQYFYTVSAGAASLVPGSLAWSSDKKQVTYSLQMQSSTPPMLDFSTASQEFEDLVRVADTITYPTGPVQLALNSTTLGQAIAVPVAASWQRTLTIADVVQAYSPASASVTFVQAEILEVVSAYGERQTSVPGIAWLTAHPDSWIDVALDGPQSLRLSTSTAQADLLAQATVQLGVNGTDLSSKSASEQVTLQLVVGPGSFVELAAAELSSPVRVPANSRDVFHVNSTAAFGELVRVVSLTSAAGLPVPEQIWWDEELSALRIDAPLEYYLAHRGSQRVLTLPLSITALAAQGTVTRTVTLALTPPHQYHAQVGEWSQCSCTATGTRTQRRAFWCADSTGAAVSPSNCDAPELQRSCACADTGAYWLAGSWSACSRQCYSAGGQSGTTTRQVACVHGAGSSMHVVADSQCQSQPMPPIQRSCNALPCSSYDIVAGSGMCTSQPYQDATGACCAGPWGAHGLCCDLPVDECGVCGGVNACPVTIGIMMSQLGPRSDSACERGQLPESAVMATLQDLLTVQPVGQPQSPAMLTELHGAAVQPNGLPMQVQSTAVCEALNGSTSASTQPNLVYWPQQVMLKMSRFDWEARLVQPMQTELYYQVRVDSIEWTRSNAPSIPGTLADAASRAALLDGSVCPFGQLSGTVQSWHMCSGHGVCKSGACACQPGHSGPACELCEPGYLLGVVQDLATNGSQLGCVMGASGSPFPSASTMPSPSMLPSFSAAASSSQGASASAIASASAAASASQCASRSAAASVSQWPSNSAAPMQPSPAQLSASATVGLAAGSTLPQPSHTPGASNPASFVSSAAPAVEDITREDAGSITVSRELVWVVAGVLMLAVSALGGTAVVHFCSGRAQVPGAQSTRDAVVSSRHSQPRRSVASVASRAASAVVSRVSRHSRHHPERQGMLHKHTAVEMDSQDTAETGSVPHRASVRSSRHESRASARESRAERTSAPTRAAGLRMVRELERDADNGNFLLLSTRSLLDVTGVQGSEDEASQ